MLRGMYGGCKGVYAGERGRTGVPGCVLLTLATNTCYASYTYYARTRTPPLVSAMPFQLAPIASVAGSSRSASLVARLGLGLGLGLG